jgi:hypothetical protein
MYVYIWMYMYLYVDVNVYMCLYSYAKDLNEFLHSDELPLLDPKSADKVCKYEYMGICMYLYVYVYVYINMCIHSYGKDLNEFLHSDELPLLDPKSAHKIYEYEYMEICMYIYVFICI